MGILLSAESGRDRSDETSSVDVGGQVGIGAVYSAGPGSITLDVRAGFCFTNIYDIKDTQFGSIDRNVTNQVLPSATVGYAYEL